MTRVLLIDDADRVSTVPLPDSDCACDCDCACPIDALPAPLLTLPVAYYLELTGVCHNRCPGCGNVYADIRAQLPHSLDGATWSALIRRLATHAQQFKLTGGEATLHPDFVEIVRTVESCEIPFTLFTNGRWHHPNDLIHFLKTQTTCQGLLVSLHGPDAAAHEFFCGVPGAFVETVRNIRLAIEAGLNVAISTVIHHANWRHVAETADLALSLGVNHVVFNRLLGHHDPALAPTSVELRMAMQVVEALRSSGHPVRFGNCIPQCFKTSSSTGCTAGRTFATIDPWGRLRPCNHTDWIAGNILTQPIEEVWQGEVLNHWRALTPTACTTCAAWPICQGGCHAEMAQAKQLADPLMCGPLDRAWVWPKTTLRLYEHARPLGSFQPRTEQGRQVLVQRGQVVLVPPKFEPVLATLDGSTSLRQIEIGFGSAAVDWLGSLYESGLITWA